MRGKTHYGHGWYLMEEEVVLIPKETKKKEDE